MTCADCRRRTFSQFGQDGAGARVLLVPADQIGLAKDAQEHGEDGIAQHRIDLPRRHPAVADTSRLTSTKGSPERSERLRSRTRDRWNASSDRIPSRRRKSSIRAEFHPGLGTTEAFMTSLPPHKAVSVRLIIRDVSPAGFDSFSFQASRLIEYSFAPSVPRPHPRDVSQRDAVVSLPATLVPKRRRGAAELSDTPQTQQTCRLS